MFTVHKPVMLQEIIKYFNPQSGQNFIDCTFGGGGHSLEILKRINPNGKLLAIDANKNIKSRIKNEKLFNDKNFIFINDNFTNLENIIKNNLKIFFKRNVKFDGILLDLGLSSDELENSGRGFSFQKDEPLDMRFDVRQDLTATDVVNSYSINDLCDVFKNYGEYNRAYELSKSIFKQRKLKKIKTTQELVKLILNISCKRGKLHPATKVFQALRIEVNNELNNLIQVLPHAIDNLQSKGKLVVISFHSLEDRIIKNYFRKFGRGKDKILNILTKKPIVPTYDEIKRNRKSRSAKMRIVEKI